jgi:hypothetical protein
MTTNVNNNTRLQSSQAPAFPFAPVQYEQRYHDQCNRILTQYLNQNDNINNTVVGRVGGRFINFPHVAAQDTTDQYTTDNTATKVSWNTFDSQNGFITNADDITVPVNSVRAQNTGIYKIDYSLQFANTDSQEHTAYVWLRVNTNDVAGSASKFTMPAKHGSGDGYVVAYSSVVFEIEAGDDVALYWATDVARVLPATDGVYMEHYAAQTTPFAMPSIPSAIGCITFVSSILA